MVTRPRRRLRPPSPGTVMGAAALIIALAGPAQALPGINTIFSDDIAPSEVKAADIGPGEVRPSEIGTNAVVQTKIADNAVGADELEPTTVVETLIPTPAAANSPATALAYCPDGAQIVSGAFGWDLNVPGLNVTSIVLNTTDDYVVVTGHNATEAARSLTARAVCIAQ